MLRQIGAAAKPLRNERSEVQQCRRKPEQRKAGLVTDKNAELLENIGCSRKKSVLKNKKFCEMAFTKIKKRQFYIH